jgi:hypothetical protein
MGNSKGSCPGQGRARGPAVQPEEESSPAKNLGASGPVYLTQTEKVLKVQRRIQEPSMYIKRKLPYNQTLCVFQLQETSVGPAQG